MLLLHGDCLELMKTLPDRSVDLFLCDLPYGCLTGGAGKEKAKRNATGDGGVFGCSWDIKLDLDAFWAQVERLMKDDHTPIIHFCNARFGFDLYNSKPDWFRYDLVWNKMRGISFLLANKMPMRSHENIYVFAKKGARYYRKDIGRCVLSVVDFNTRKGKHPTQKPVDLYAWLIERYSKEGDTILDPTAGSFASVFTAEKMGRKAIGIEMDETFFKKAENLLASV